MWILWTFNEINFVTNCIFVKILWKFLLGSAIGKWLATQVTTTAQQKGPSDWLCFHHVCIIVILMIWKYIIIIIIQTNGVLWHSLVSEQYILIFLIACFRFCVKLPCVSLPWRRPVPKSCTISGFQHRKIIFSIEELFLNNFFDIIV